MHRLQFGPRHRITILALVFPVFLNGLQRHAIFTSDRFSSQMKAKGKTHVCFPQRPLFQPGMALQAASATPLLAIDYMGLKCVLSCVL